MNKILSLLSLSVILLAGCASAPNIGPAVTQASVYAAASFGIQQNPDVLPYIKAAQPIICQAADGRTIDPAAIVANLQSANVEALKTPEAELIINSVLAIYEGVYYSYGADIQASVVQPYLQATCDGLTQAIGNKLTAMNKALAAPKFDAANWPRVK